MRLNGLKKLHAAFNSLLLESADHRAHNVTHAAVDLCTQRRPSRARRSASPIALTALRTPPPSARHYSPDCSSNALTLTPTSPFAILTGAALYPPTVQAPMSPSPSLALFEPLSRTAPARRHCITSPPVRRTIAPLLPRRT
ncbi:hypothetical protein U1Q18_022441 [Sarracenia purpurea var. burkii]